MMRRTAFALLACTGMALGCQREKPDSAVNAAVLARLEREPALAEGQLEVRTEGGHVILSGQVATPEQRRLAEHVADEVSGVRGITNEIQIDVSAPPPTPAPRASPSESPAPPPPEPEEERE